MTENVSQSPPPAGWYPDNSGRQRWWDGSQWTEHYQPVPPVVLILQANGYAIASMVLGITGFALSLTIILIVVAIPMAVVGFILGFIGLGNANRSGGRGRAQAITGIVLCGLPFVLWIIGSIMSLASDTR